MLDNLLIFDSARKLFPGVKRGSLTEFRAFKKKHKDWIHCLKLLEPAIAREIAYKDRLVRAKEFCPEWPLFKTWLSQRRWEQEFPAEKKKTDRSPWRRCPLCGKYLDSVGHCICGYEKNET